MNRVKYKDIPLIRARILAEQEGKCAICSKDLADCKACLDHCHLTGWIRGVLCSWCNRTEGIVAEQAKRADISPVQYMVIMLDYVENHPTNVGIHPKHRTAEEEALEKELRKVRGLLKRARTAKTKDKHRAKLKKLKAELKALKETFND